MLRFVIKITSLVAPDDYTAFPPPEQLLDAFTLTRLRQCFDVVIRNNNMYEPDEQFTVNLTNLTDQTNYPRVTVDPDLVTIFIQDDDGEYSSLSDSV